MRRIAIFAHFDAQQEVKRFILHHLECLREICQSVVFVSTSPIQPTHAKAVADLCDRVILRENVGYDFSMWQHGIEAVSMVDWDELVLTNSSIFGPLFPLDAVFARMQVLDCDFWGMTENTAISPHIQTYFTVFRSRILRSNAFGTFWRSVLPYHDKYQTIRSYEVGLTSYFVDQGFTSASFIPRGSVRSRWPSRNVQDMTLSHPLELLNAKMPYVKVGLLRDNPKHINLRRVRQAIADSGYDQSLIEFDRKHGIFQVGHS